MIPEYQIIPSRRKTLAIEITPKGEVLVRCPARMSRGEVHRFVCSRESWITAHLEKLAPLLAVPELTGPELEALIREAREVIPSRTAQFARQMGIPFGRITIRSQRTRWGSCSAAGNLSFNCLLMLAPEDIRDYVIVHELCHRKEMNHSPRFWAQVEAVLPHYRSCRQWLKDNGPALMARLPGYAQK